MSDATTAVATPFALQRRFIEQSHRAARQGIDVQRRFVRAFADTLDAQRDAQQNATRLAETALEAWLVAARTSMPPETEHASEYETAAEDAFAGVEDVQNEWFEAFSRSVTDGVELYDQSARAYLEFLDATFEATLEANDRAAENAAWLADAGERAVGTDVEVQEP